MWLCRRGSGLLHSEASSWNVVTLKSTFETTIHADADYFSRQAHVYVYDDLTQMSIEYKPTEWLYILPTGTPKTRTLIGVFLTMQTKKAPHCSSCDPHKTHTHAPISRALLIPPIHVFLFHKTARQSSGSSHKACMYALRCTLQQPCFWKRITLCVNMATQDGHLGRTTCKKWRLTKQLSHARPMSLSLYVCLLLLKSWRGPCFLHWFVVCCNFPPEYKKKPALHLSNTQQTKSVFQKIDKTSVVHCSSPKGPAYTATFVPQGPLRQRKNRRDRERAGEKCKPREGAHIVQKR